MGYTHWALTQQPWHVSETFFSPTIQEMFTNHQVGVCANNATWFPDRRNERDKVFTLMRLNLKEGHQQ